MQFFPYILALSIALLATWGLAQEADPVVQPGIVEAIPPPWTGATRPFDALDPFSFGSPSPFHAAIAVSASWNDNVLIFQKPPLEDFLWDTTVSVWFESSPLKDGRRHYVKFGYEPRILRYDELESLDTVNHQWFSRYLYRGNRIWTGVTHRDAEFSGETSALDSAIAATDVQSTVADTLEAEAEQQDLTEAERDFARRVEGYRQTTNAFATLSFSDEAMFRVAAMRNYRTFEGLAANEVEEWWLEGLFYRQLTSKLRLGAGPRFGLLDLSDAPNQNYQQALGRFFFTPSDKVRIDGHAGADFREFGEPAGSETTPIFSARLTWMPSESTELSIEGFQQARGSFLGDAITATGARWGARQRLFRDFEYSLLGGFVVSDYEPAAAGVRSPREDEYLFLRNAFAYRLGEMGDVSVFHEYRENTSSADADFERNLSGVSLTFEF